MEKYIQVSNEMKELFYFGFSENQIDEFEEDLNKILENLINYKKNINFNLI